MQDNSPGWLLSHLNKRMHIGFDSRQGECHFLSSVVSRVDVPCLCCPPANAGVWDPVAIQTGQIRASVNREMEGRTDVHTKIPADEN